MTTAEDTAIDVNLVSDERPPPEGHAQPPAPTHVTDRLNAWEGDSAGNSRCARVDVSIVVPLYNEAQQAAAFLMGLRDALEKNRYDYEVVLVDDGSTDATAEVLGAVATGDPRVQLVCLPRNAGQHHATLVGMRAARGNIVVTMDADVRIEANQLHQLVETLRVDNRCDVASAMRNDRTAGLLRRPASYAVTFLTNFVCRTKLKDPGSTLIAMRREVVDRALQNEILAQNLPMFLAYAGFRINEVDLGTIPQVGRKSRYSVASLVMTLVLAMLNYSSGARALTFLLVVGGSMAAGGVTLCGGVVLHGMWRQTVLPTNILLAGLLGVVLGGQFMAMSMLGYKLETLMRNLRLRGMPMQFPHGTGSFVERTASAGDSAKLVPMTG